MNPARLVSTYDFNDVSFLEFVCDAIGDGLALHHHGFNHITIVKTGRCEVFDDVGNAVEVTDKDEPIMFPAKRVHGIRALDAGARFINVRPV